MLYITDISYISYIKYITPPRTKPIITIVLRGIGLFYCKGGIQVEERKQELQRIIASIDDVGLIEHLLAHVQTIIKVTGGLEKNENSNI